MCGVVGVVSSRSVDPERMERALRALKNRGPDGEGVWWSEDRRVGLGHRRLAINDPEGGAQPLVTDRFITSLNGEFYDLPSRYRNSTDSRALPDYLESFPVEEALSALNGEFAGLVYDRAHRRLLAARDRFGVKPLYWAYREEELWLASKPSALWAAGVRPGWCERGFVQAASTQYPLPGRTIFSGIFTLKPGHYLQVKKGEIEERPYWKLPALNPSSPAPDLREELERAVLRRLRRGCDNAVLLSGGIDSAAVLALASRSGESVTAYSVDFIEQAQTSFSEADLAVAQAAHCGVPHRLLELNGKEILENLSTVVKALEGPVVNGHAVAKWRLSRAIKDDGCKVVLSGEGADELLFGYRHFSPYFGGLNQAPDDPAGLGILVTRATESPIPPDWPTFFHAKYHLGQKIGAFLSLPLQPLSAFEAVLTPLETSTPRETARQAWLQTALSSYILETLGDGTEMAHSVEGRPPFLDHELWETVASMPPPDGNKTLLRQAMKGLVIPEITAKPKHPFMAGPLGEPLLAVAENVVSDSAHPFVDRTRALRLLRALRKVDPERRSEWEPAVLWVLSSYYLQELWT